ncbi:DUF1569 domain-containing protein [Aquabacterium sp.]|uniref:DUF1569 domain-containing protein n=1 Tax=Aquabacterium sp. TaxID=1872578 RepID=UPI002CF48DC3|nr:DUF1569 domain-containing protein [Aquabacterium sp.]HSW06213.1 DUF1569 domain-containing protein [Aquabacterium sp.]
MARRRSLLLAATGAPLAAGLAGCGDAPVQRFATLADARVAVAALADGRTRTADGWPLVKVLQHAAQSIDYSIDGYPELKSAMFRHTVGAAAWGVFNARGAMRHALDEPIPGATTLDATLPLEQAIGRLMTAFARFDAHTGALKPHFAYGALDKPAYARAHLMHLANHWSAFVTTPPAPGPSA